MRPARTIAAVILTAVAAITTTARLQPAAAATTNPAPITVPLGTHTFSHLRPPDAIVAHAGPNDVGFCVPPSCHEGVPLGPQSFDVASDGSTWLLDQGNHRLLVWQPGQPDRPARAVQRPMTHLTGSTTSRSHPTAPSTPPTARRASSACAR